MNYLHYEAKEGKLKKIKQRKKENPIRAICCYTTENEKEQQIQRLYYIISYVFEINTKTRWGILQ